MSKYGVEQQRQQRLHLGPEILIVGVIELSVLVGGPVGFHSLEMKNISDPVLPEFQEYPKLGSICSLQQQS